MAPAGTATGGPEGLHQLAYALKKNLNLNIMMYYVPKNVDNPVHGNYKEYSIDYTKNIEDGSVVAGFPAIDIKIWKKNIINQYKNIR